MGPKLIFSFDSEDYETPAADDAELWWAQAMTRHGLRASVCLVGELARALRDRGRQDVFDAWQPHEIAYHSDMHSAHPTHAEYLDELDWDAGCRRVEAEERAGVSDVRNLTGRQPIAHCKPGASWGPQVAATMNDLQLPVFCDAPFEWSPGRPAWYCGALMLKYHHHFDGYFAEPENRVERMKRDLEQKLETAPSDGYVVMFTHPCRLLTSAFPDNFTAGQNPPREDWRPAPLRPQQEVDAIKGDFDEFLRWVGEELKPDLGSYADLYRAHHQSSQQRRRLGGEEVAGLATAVPDVPGPVEWGGSWLSAAEQWTTLIRIVSGDERRLPLWEALGPVEQPAALDEPVGLPFADFRRLCRTELESAYLLRRLPAAVPVNGAHIGPNALLQAARQAIREQASSGEWPARVVIRPAEETPALAEREDIARVRYHHTWSIFSPDFEGRNLLKHVRRQLWTMKPA